VYGSLKSNSAVSNWLVPKTLHRSFKLETNNIQRTAVFGMSHCLHIYQFSKIITEKKTAIALVKLVIIH
jgi:hypothetical protein